MTTCAHTPAYIEALLAAAPSAEQEAHAAACDGCRMARMRIATFDEALAGAARSLVTEPDRRVPTSQDTNQGAATRPRMRLGTLVSSSGSRRRSGRLGAAMAVASVAVLLAGFALLATFVRFPSLLPGTGPADGRAEERGIVVEIWLDHHEVRPGDVVQALVRVSNRSHQVIMRETNTCGLGPATTTVVRTADGNAGAADWTGLAGDFKRFVLRGTGLGVGEWELGRFFAARAGGDEVGCMLHSQAGPFAPGAVEDAVLAWRVTKPEESPLEPGPATVRAVFSELSDASDSDPITVVAETSIEILADGSGTEEPVVGPTLVDYLDAALSDASFVAWLAERPAETWKDAMVTYWPTGEGSYPEITAFDRLGQRSVVEVTLWRQLPPDQLGPADMPEGELRSVTVDRATLVVLAVRDPIDEPSQTPEPLGPCNPVDEGGDCFEPDEQAFIDHALASTRAWPQLAGLAVQATDVIEAYDAAAKQPTWIVPITSDGRVVAASRFLPFGRQVRLGEIALYQPPRDSVPRPGSRQRLVLFTETCGDPMPDRCLFNEYGWRIEPTP